MDRLEPAGLSFGPAWRLALQFSGCTTTLNPRVSVQNNQLVIEGERKAPEGFDKNAFTQLAYGRFYTALTLPTGLDVDHVSCRLWNGILEIQVPITETSKPKQIQIQTGEVRKAIHA